MTPGTVGLQNPLRDVQQEAPVCHCRRCQGEVYRGETLYTWDGAEICQDCFQSIITDWVDKNPREVADTLCVDTRELM